MKIIYKIKSLLGILRPNIINCSRNLQVAVVSGGGVGDGIVNLNYIKHLYKYCDCCIDIDFYFKPNIVKCIYCEQERYLKGYYKESDIFGKERKYDLVIHIKERFPRICYYNNRRINKSPKLKILVSSYLDKYNKLKFFYDKSPRTDGFSIHFSMIYNKKRFQQPDIDNRLGINSIDIKISTKNDMDVLNKFGLKPYKYTTFNRSVDSSVCPNRSTKLWPFDYYVELIGIQNKKYPNVLPVLLGPQCEEFKTDTILNLTGKTTFDELLVILKYSLIHIGPEGGMIHLRHILCSLPSCVLFGPTSNQFYGYNENINIEGEGCVNFCEWYVPNWQKECLKNGTITCDKLKNISPQFVFEQIEKFLI